MQERLVGREGAMLAQPGDRLVGQVLAQVVVLVVRRLDRVEVLDEPRLPLRGLAGQEAVEVVEADALAGRPEVNGPIAVVSVAGVLCHLPKAAVL